MKAITLWEPWATLMAYGYKRFETRSWLTNYRGPIAIHAAKKMDEEIVSWCLRKPFVDCLIEIGIRQPTKFHLGCILAIGELVGCHSTTGLIGRDIYRNHAAPYESEFGNYAIGRYAWKIINIQRLQEPIPVRGFQGLWDWEPPEEK